MTRMRRLGWSVVVLALAGSATYLLLLRGRAPASHEGMQWLPGGQFAMGTSDPNSFANERPAHEVTVDGFWMDEHPVTNAEFRRFVQATGYLTTAERPVQWG